MANLKFTFTTQYPGNYYAVVHNQNNFFVNANTFLISSSIDDIKNFCIPLIKKEFNTYVADVIADNLDSGIYTFRVYQKAGNDFNASKDDLVSVGQTGWNKDLKIQQNADDVISSIEAYEARQENIYRLDILMDSAQLGLSNNESGFVRIEIDTVTGTMRLKSFWSLNSNISPTRISIRGPASLGKRSSPLVSYPISSSNNNFTLTSKIESSIMDVILAKRFYVTIDTSGSLNGRIGGYPIYTPSVQSTASGSVSFSVQPISPSTGISFRTS